MNMGSLRAELAFPASYAAQPELDRRDNGGAAGGGHHEDYDSDDDDGELDEDVMILGSTPQVRRMLHPRVALVPDQYVSLDLHVTARWLRMLCMH